MRVILVPFSKRFEKSLESGAIQVILPKRVRGRIWRLLKENNVSFGVRAEKKVGLDLKKLYGVNEFPCADENGMFYETDNVGVFFDSCDAPQVFDTVQYWYGYLEPKQQFEFQQELNAILEQEETGWIFCDQHFFRVDSAFLSESVLNKAHELLVSNNYQGPLDEFVRAREHLEAGAYKESVHAACNAFESLMKIVESADRGPAMQLIERLPKMDFYRGLPDEIQTQFGEKVLYALPFLRNELGGHGQGRHVVDPPKEFAELAVHLAGTFIFFLIKRHLAISPPQEPKTETQKSDDLPYPVDDLPF